MSLNARTIKTRTYSDREAWSIARSYQFKGKIDLAIKWFEIARSLQIKSNKIAAR